MSGVFKSCIPCKPPKRYPGCQDSCPDYRREWEKNQKVLQAKYREAEARSYGVGAHGRMTSKARGINHHAK